VTAWLPSFVAAPPTSWQWIWGHRLKAWHLFLEHLELTVLAVGIGLLIALPLAVYSYRHRSAYGPITSVAGIIYTIPSLALLSLLVPLTGFSVTTAEIALVGYTLLILIRNVVVGLRSVPEDSKEAARGMGYTNRQLLWRVELPLSIPAVLAGVRIATVSTIGLVTVAGLIGKGGFGYFMFEGLRILYFTEVLLGAVLSVAFALVADALLLWLEHWLTPWLRRARVRSFG
jgi:osmoprotectant transport system permease protein